MLSFDACLFRLSRKRLCRGRRDPHTCTCAYAAAASAPPLPKRCGLTTGGLYSSSDCDAGVWPKLTRCRLYSVGGASG